MPEFREKCYIADVHALRSTESAVLCLIENEEIWIPQSQIDDESEVWEEGDNGTLVISLWIAEQKGL
jgi:hypothetical protein